MVVAVVKQVYNCNMICYVCNLIELSLNVCGIVVVQVITSLALCCHDSAIVIVTVIKIIGHYFISERRHDDT